MASGFRNSRWEYVWQICQEPQDDFPDLVEQISILPICRHLKNNFCKICTFHVQYLQVCWYLLQEELSGVYAEFGTSSMTSAPTLTNFSLVLQTPSPGAPGSDDWLMFFKHKQDLVFLIQVFGQSHSSAKSTSFPKILLKDSLLRNFSWAGSICSF